MCKKPLAALPLVEGVEEDGGHQPNYTHNRENNHWCNSNFLSNRVHLSKMKEITQEEGEEVADRELDVDPE